MFIYFKLQKEKIIQRTISGKKCIRILLDRSRDAQVRKNPIHRDESFQCCVCKRQVKEGEVQIRDHCPFCLHGLHLDESGFTPVVQPIVGCGSAL